MARGGRRQGITNFNSRRPEPRRVDTPESVTENLQTEDDPSSGTGGRDDSKPKQDVPKSVQVEDVDDDDENGETTRLRQVSLPFLVHPMITQTANRVCLQNWSNLARTSFQ